MGLQNKIFAPWANYLAHSFPKLKNMVKLSNGKLIHTGIPIDEDIITPSNINKNLLFLLLAEVKEQVFLIKILPILYKI